MLWPWAVFLISRPIFHSQNFINKPGFDHGYIVFDLSFYIWAPDSGVSEFWVKNSGLTNFVEKVVRVALYMHTNTIICIKKFWVDQFDLCGDLILGKKFWVDQFFVWGDLILGKKILG